MPLFLIESWTWSQVSSEMVGHAEDATKTVTDKIVT